MPLNELAKLELLENFSYLSILQVCSLLFPFITYPYLLRLFGLELYGVTVFAQTIAINISLLINYGFNLSGTQIIAINRDNKEVINEIVSSIYIIKFLIWLLCLIIYCIIIICFNYFSSYRTLYIVSYFLTVNEVLLPVWYFQGIEKMKYMTFINLTIRFIFVCLIFIIVKNPSQYIFVPLLHSIGAVMGGIMALIIVFSIHRVSFQLPSYSVLKRYFNNSTPFFISALSVNVYAYIGKFVVGLFLGMREITIYDMAEKVTSLMKLPGGLATQASFPRICKLKSIPFVNKLLIITLLSAIILYIVLFLFSNKIVFLLSGEHITIAVTIIRILALTTICAAVNGFFGSNRLVIWGYKKIYMKVAISGCFIYLFCLLFLFLTNFISIYSIACLPLITEASIVLIYIIIARDKHLLY